jgi:Zn-dependent protease
VAGIEIGINWTWLGIFALILWSLAGVEFPADAPGRPWPTYALMGVVATAAFFASLILHELGHATQARREGVCTDGITLWLFGGVAKLGGEFPSAGAELRIALAGPLVTLVIGSAALLLTAVWPQAGAVRAVLAWLGYINVALLVFNLVPALPLDGGRVLRALLWARTRDLAVATHRASRIGSVLAAMLIGLGLVETLQGAFGGLWVALIGWFVLAAGRAEEQHVLTRDLLGHTPVGAADDPRTGHRRPVGLARAGGGLCARNRPPHRLSRRLGRAGGGVAAAARPCDHTPRRVGCAHRRGTACSPRRLCST